MIKKSFSVSLYEEIFVQSKLQELTKSHFSLFVVKKMLAFLTLDTINKIYSELSKYLHKLKQQKIYDRWKVLLEEIKNDFLKQNKQNKKSSETAKRGSNNSENIHINKIELNNSFNDEVYGDFERFLSPELPNKKLNAYLSPGNKDMSGKIHKHLDSYFVKRKSNNNDGMVEKGALSNQHINESNDNIQNTSKVYCNSNQNSKNNLPKTFKSNESENKKTSKSNMAMPFMGSDGHLSSQSPLPINSDNSNYYYQKMGNYNQNNTNNNLVNGFPTGNFNFVSNNSNQGNSQQQQYYLKPQNVQNSMVMMSNQNQIINNFNSNSFNGFNLNPNQQNFQNVSSKFPGNYYHQISEKSFLNSQNLNPGLNQFSSENNNNNSNTSFNNNFNNNYISNSNNQVNQFSLEGPHFIGSPNNIQFFQQNNNTFNNMNNNMNNYINYMDNNNNINSNIGLNNQNPLFSSNQHVQAITSPNNNMNRYIEIDGYSGNSNSILNKLNSHITGKNQNQTTMNFSLKSQKSFNNNSNCQMLNNSNSNKIVNSVNVPFNNRITPFDSNSPFTQQSSNINPSNFVNINNINTSPNFSLINNTKNNIEKTNIVIDSFPNNFQLEGHLVNQNSNSNNSNYNVLQQQNQQKLTPQSQPKIIPGNSNLSSTNSLNVNNNINKQQN